MQFMYKIFIPFAVIIMACGAYAATDEFDFSNFAITEGGNTDLNADTISINPDAMPITVSNFDIAGIMLGASLKMFKHCFLRPRDYTVRVKKTV